MIRTGNLRRWRLAGVAGIGVAVLGAIWLALRPKAPLERLGSDERSIVDPELGRMPKPGLAITGIRDSTASHAYSFRIDDDGVRSNGATKPKAERPLTLVVGDSYAFGDDVDDDASWPAVLERALDRRVVNGGVPGFGLDQTVLRAERLASKFKADSIVVAFIPHDVIRCEISAWQGYPKPYFEITGGPRRELRFHGMPAVIGDRAPSSPLRNRFASNRWLDDFLSHGLGWRGPITYAHHEGEAVACLLMPRLAALAERSRARVLVVAYPEGPVISTQEKDHSDPGRTWGRKRTIEEELHLKGAVLDCARKSNLETLDLFPAFLRLSFADRQALYDGHMTPAGNTFVAREVAEALKRAAPYSAP